MKNKLIKILTKIVLRKGKRGHKDSEINLKEGISGRERQNLIACLKHQYRDVKIIDN